MEEAVVSAISGGGDFWDTLGPYLLTACAALVLATCGLAWSQFQDTRKDVRWMKHNLTKVMAQLGIEPEND